LRWRRITRQCLSPVKLCLAFCDIFPDTRDSELGAGDVGVGDTLPGLGPRQEEGFENVVPHCLHRTEA